MNHRVQLRLAALVIVILVVMSLIGWNSYEVATVMTQEGTTPQEQRIVQAQYAQIARELLPPIQELDRALYRAVLLDDRSARELFLKESEKTRKDLDELKANSRRARITVLKAFSFDAPLGALLDAVVEAYASYIAKASEALGREGAPRDPRAQSAAFVEANDSYRLLWVLGSRAAAKGESLDLSLTGHADRIQAEPVRLVLSFALLLILIGLCIWLMIAAYHMVVRPLHREVTEKAVVIERQSKLASLGELAAGLAHEIRNPLTAINARVYTLHQSLPAESEEHADAVVIREEIKRLDAIVGDFLTLARPTEPRLAEVRADALLRAAHELMQPALKKRGIEVKLDASTDVTLQADAQQLKQVLINLIQNAAESIEHDGTVSLRAHTGRFPLEGRPTEALFIEVTDTGHGIPDDVRANLFDPFFSTKEGGTGLGLPIARRIVLQHRGEMDFQTQIGRGTTFRVILPVNLTGAAPHG